MRQKEMRYITMADLNKVILAGTVPYFDDPAKRFVVFNDRDEKKMHGVMKLNVQTAQKDENGNYKSEIYEVTVWGKKCEALKKFNVKGKGLIFEGRLTPSRKKENVDGSVSWTGMGFSAYDFYTQRTSNERSEDTSAAPAAPSAGPVAPAAPAAPAAPSAPAAPVVTGGSEDWPF